MRNLKLTLLGLFTAVLAHAQFESPAPSPSSTLTQEVGLTTVTIEYSRPGVKDRTIFGGLLKYDELWRTGANAATKLTFSDDVTLAGNTLKAGDYVILTVPGKSEWKVNIYDFVSAGVGQYFDKEPVASATVKSESLSSKVETFTIDINNIKNSSATIDLIWENTKVSIPLAVNTDAEMMKQIASYDKSSKMSAANDYNGMASYLLSEKKELEKALEFSQKACELNPNAFWMSRTQSLILAELGRYKEAIGAAKKSLEAAEAANNQTYIDFNTAAIAEWKKKK